MHQTLVIGAGSIGERHLRCFQATGRVQTAFVEPRDELREAIAERYGVRGFRSLDEAPLAAFTVSVICTPAPLHVAQALQCVRTGHHVLIEKPLSTSLDGLEELRSAVVDAGRIAGVAYVYRCLEVIQRLRSALASEQFGKPLQFVCVCGQHFPTYRPAYREIYYADRMKGGGAIQDALTHVMNAGEWLLGPITRLVADAEHLALPDVMVEDTVHVIARHGEVMASYSLNQHQAPNEMLLTVVCERGTLRVELPSNRFWWMAEPAGTWTVEDLGPLERDTAFIAQANEFLDAIEGKAPMPCSLDDGAQTLRVNLAALESVEARSWQVL